MVSLRDPPFGPFLFNVYTLPIADIIRSHGLSFHIYADNNDNYISFKPDDCDQNLVNFRNCIADLRIWLKENFLMLNDDKTLYAIFVHHNNVQNYHHFRWK